MNKKLLFLAIAAQLLSYKSTVGIQQEEFIQHLALYRDASSKLSLLPPDLENCILSYLLLTVRYDPAHDKHFHSTFDNMPVPSPLHFVASNGLTALARHLIATGANKNIINLFGKTPCDLAAENAHYDLAGALLTKALDEDAPRRETPLHRAVRSGDMALVQTLLDAGAWVDKRSRWGYTALHTAAANNQIPLIDLLLRAGATVDATCDLGMTPLQLASELGHDEVVRKLIAIEASLDRSSHSGHTSLHFAACNGNDSTVEILLQAGAKHLKDKCGKTPLHLAAEKCDSAIITKLLATADIDSCDNKERTPLHCAVCAGNDVAVELLLQAGANKDQADSSGKTPLQWATENRYRPTGMRHWDGGVVPYHEPRVERDYARVCQLLANEPLEDSGVCVQM